MGSKTGLSEIPNVQIGSQSGGNVQIGSLPNMERFHLESSTAGSLEAQLRAGKSTCTGMPQKCRHGFLNCVSYFSKSNFPTADTPFLLSRFLTFRHLLYVINNATCIVIYRDVSVCIEGRFLQWGTLKEHDQVEKAAGGEMVCFLSHQVSSSEPSFITERARGYP